MIVAGAAMVAASGLTVGFLVVRAEALTPSLMGSPRFALPTCLPSIHQLLVLLSVIARLSAGSTYASCSGKVGTVRVWWPEAWRQLSSWSSGFRMSRPQQ